jgi:hypothetical protein
MYIFDELSLIIESSAAMPAQLPCPSGGEMAITILCQIVIYIRQIRQTQQYCGNINESKVLVNHFWIYQNL